MLYYHQHSNQRIDKFVYKGNQHYTSKLELQRLWAVFYMLRAVVNVRIMYVVLHEKKKQVISVNISCQPSNLIKTAWFISCLNTGCSGMCQTSKVCSEIDFTV